MLESRPGQLLPIGSTKDSQAAAAAAQQQKRILDKVWATVEKVMGEMKNQLSAKLQEPSRGVEEQEKTIEYVTLLPIHGVMPYSRLSCSILLELSTTEEPVWIYVDAQHKAILAQMRETYNNAVNVIRGMTKMRPTLLPIGLTISQ